MPRVPFPIVGGSYNGVSKDANPQRSINLYPEYDKSGGRSLLRGTPGLSVLKDLRTETLGNEQITNGDFADSDTGWSLDESWEVSGAKLVKNAPESIDFEGGESTSTILGSNLVTNGAFSGDAMNWEIGTGWSYDAVNGNCHCVGLQGLSEEMVTNYDFSSGDTGWNVVPRLGTWNGVQIVPRGSLSPKWSFTGNSLDFLDSLTYFNQYIDFWSDCDAYDGGTQIWQELPLKKGKSYHIEIVIKTGADFPLYSPGIASALFVGLGEARNPSRIHEDRSYGIRYTDRDKVWQFFIQEAGTYRVNVTYLDEVLDGREMPRGGLTNGVIDALPSDGVVGIRLGLHKLWPDYGITSFSIDSISVKEVIPPGSLAQSSADMVSSPAAGTNYVLEYTATVTSGSITPYLSGDAGQARSVDGDFIETIHCGSDGTGLRFIPSADFIGTIDTVSLKEFPRTVTTYTHLPAPVLGDELITNGTFTGSANSWTLDSTWAYNTNKVTRVLPVASTILNEDFSAGLTGWTQYKPAGTNIEVIDGICKLTSYPTSGYWPYISRTFPILSGRHYTITFYRASDSGVYYSAVAEAVNVRISATGMDAIVWNALNTPGAPGAGIKTMSFTATATATATIKFCSEAWQYLRFDDIIIHLDAGTPLPGSAIQANASLAKDFNQSNLYYMSCDISDRTTGALTVSVGDKRRNKKVFTTNGTYEIYLEDVESGADVAFDADADFDGSIDNVSICEAITSSSPAIARQYNEDMVSPIVKNHDYRVEFTADSISGGKILVELGGAQYDDPITEARDYSIDITAEEDSGLSFIADYTASASLDDVSVKEIIYPNYQVRALVSIDEDLYIVYGPYLSKLNANLELTTLNASSPMATKSGLVTIAHIRSGNGFQIMICDGSNKVAYLYDTYAETFTVLNETDYNFEGGGSVAAIDGYFLSNGVGTDNIFYSEVSDGTLWDAADFTRAWVKTSNVQRVFAHERYAWAFKKDSTEIFYNSGASGAESPTFERVDGGILNVGLLATWSPASVKEKLFWLASDKTVQMAVGQNIQTVSTPQLSYQIEQMSTASDAVGYGYTEEGHDFYVLSFPTADVTYVYDATTGEWHERQSYDTDRGVDGRHRSNCYAYFQGRHVIGDFANTKLYELDGTAYTEDGNRIIRQRITQNVNENNLMSFFNALEIHFEGGIGNTNGQGSEPKAILRISKDGGHSWSGPLTSPMGAKGGYDVRSIWRRLGCGRDFAAWTSISDPVKVVILGSYLDYKQGYA